MSWAEIKKSVNSTIGTAKAKPLNEIFEEYSMGFISVNVNIDDSSKFTNVTMTFTDKTDSSYSRTKTITSSGGVFTFNIPAKHEYTITLQEVSMYELDTKTIENISTFSGAISYYINYKIVPKFASATWEQIARVSQSGDASNIWKIGDEKTITINGTSQIVTIVDFNHDDLVSGGKAGITIALKNALPTIYNMNSSNTNSGGWNNSAMRTRMSTFLNQLPADLQNVIKPVYKKTSSGSNSSAIQTTQDKLWLFSEVEIFKSLSYSFSGEGTQYPYFATSNNRIKKQGDNGSTIGWWLRSPYSYNSTYFCFVNSDGGADAGGASNSCGVVFGFCI